MRMLCAWMLVLLLVPAVQARAEPPSAELVVDDDDDEDEADAPPTPPWDDDANPFTQAIKAPMALPWFWNASLDGWAPWGRSNGVKLTCSFLTMWCGACLVLVFPVSFAFSLLMTVMAAVVAVFAVYSFIMTGFQNGCVPKSSTVRSGTLACNSLFDVWTWAMCCSYVLCTPWFGFKLIQRGWYAVQDPVPDAPRKKKKRHKAAPPPRDDDVEGTAHRPAPPLAY